MQENRKCLMIDDDEDDHEIFKIYLKIINRDITFKGVYNGEEAIDLLKTEPLYVPDYIFLDVNMPKMNGIECLRLLRNFTKLENTKIFMYSTTSETHFLEESRILGAEDFIVKSSKSAKMVKKLCNIFKIDPNNQLHTVRS